MIVMKKIFLVLALALMSLNVFAQCSDAFFTDDDAFNNRIVDNGFTLNLPTGLIGSINNEPAPLGNGLLIISALGFLYTVKKSNNCKD